MRSILVTVDDTPSSLAARVLAAALARQAGASLRGVTGIELSDLDKVEAVPLGGAQHAYDRLKHREQQAVDRRARVAGLPAAFQRSLAEQGLEAPCSMIEADVRGALLREIQTCDMVVTGRDTEFHLEPGDGVAPLVEHLIARGGRPVVVTGPDAAGTGPVLVAYDGSVPSAKALQMATLLGLFGPAGQAGAAPLKSAPLKSAPFKSAPFKSEPFKSAHVVAVHRDRAEASAVAARAGTYLASHGVEATLESSVAAGDPADFLMRRAAEIGARMLVMGAFGHRGFREILFGSCTRRLFNTAQLPLFIYH